MVRTWRAPGLAMMLQARPFGRKYQMNFAKKSVLLAATALSAA